MYHLKPIISPLSPLLIDSSYLYLTFLSLPLSSTPLIPSYVCIVCIVPFQLNHVSTIDPSIETVLLQLGMTVSSQSTARSRMYAKMMTQGTLQADTALTARMQNDRCRTLLNTWMGKCVFGV